MVAPPRRVRQALRKEKGRMCPVCIASTAVIVAGAGSAGGILAVCIGTLASVPFSPAYSISKAAAFSLTQSLRALWAGRGVKVHAVLAGPVNTDMTRSLNIPKVSPESVARAILNGMEKGEEDIFPDPMSEGIADGWHSGVAKALERQFAAYTPESMAR